MQRSGAAQRVSLAASKRGGATHQPDGDELVVVADRVGGHREHDEPVEHVRDEVRVNQLKEEERQRAAEEEGREGAEELQEEGHRVHADESLLRLVMEAGSVASKTRGKECERCASAEQRADGAQATLVRNSARWQQLFNS